VRNSIIQVMRPWGVVIEAGCEAGAGGGAVTNAIRSQRRACHGRGGLRQGIGRFGAREVGA
jgi:hypothetical protein